MAKKEKPNALWSMLCMRCPRCRKGPMFTNRNAWDLRKTMSMPEKCPECGQPYALEVGFWYGTGYVSYGLSFLVSILTLVAWWLVIGISLKNNNFFWWMGFNAVLLILLQPWLMRLSRVLYLYIFVHYDPDHQHSGIMTFDYETEEYYKKRKDDDSPAASN